MIFDAGSKTRSKFVHYQDELDQESEINYSFTIKEYLGDGDKKLWLSLTGAPTYLKASKDTKRDKEFLLKDFSEYVFGEEGDRKKLKAVFLSHPDVDHYNIMTRLVRDHKSLFEDTTIKFLMGGREQTYVSLTHQIREIAEARRPTIICDHSKKAAKFCCPQFVVEEGEAPSVEILTVNAASKKKKDRNANSMVVKLSQKHSFITAGDAERKTWDSIKNGKLCSDVLLLSHHGAYTYESTSLELLNLINPKMILISAGFQYGHPDASTINILKTYFSLKKYHTDPHLLTFCRNKDLECVITNFPIFTTIDNGRLSVNLAGEILKVEVSRNFGPDPGVSLVGDGLPSIHFNCHSPLQVLETLHEGAKEVGCRGSIFRQEDNYYYKYLGVYFLLQAEVE